MNEKKNLKILVIDDEEIVRNFLSRFLNRHFNQVKVVENGLKALEAAKEESFDLVFLDIRMPKMNGLETFSKLKKNNPNLGCIFMTGHAAEEILLDKTKQPGTVCLRKPFEDMGQIKDMVNKVLEETEGLAETEKTGTERRTYVRLNIVLEVDYKLAKQGQECFVHSLSKDIAPCGIRLSVQENLAIGTALNLIIRTPGHKRSCQAAGMVVWAKRADDKPGFYEAGIEFAQINLSELAMLLMEEYF